MDLLFQTVSIPLILLPLFPLCLLTIYLLDINYFIRMFYVIIYGNYFARKLDFKGESILHGWVLPFDADNQLTHMNNARILREYDFGRVDFWARTGLFSSAVKDILAGKGFSVLAVANTVRYRRPLYMFVKYKLVTKAVYWDGRKLYNEHAMFTSDGIKRNVGYTQAIFPFSVDEFVEKNHPDVIKPSIPKDLELWIKFNEVNASKHRTHKRKTSDVNTSKCNENLESESDYK